MNKINHKVFLGQLNNLAGELDNFWANIGDEVFLYDFTIVSGFVYLNERGENTLNSNPANDNTNVLVQTSKEPMVAYWTDSFEGQPIINEQEVQTGIKKVFKVGKYYKSYISNISLDSSQTTIQWNNVDYNTMIVNRTINLFVEGTDFNQVDLNKHIFLILNRRAKSLQWLRLTNSTPVYSPVGDNNAEANLDGSIITLENLNLLFSTNAKDILTFVQLSCPGGNYAFPIERVDLNGNRGVWLDPKYINAIPGVSHIQLEFDSAVALMSIGLFGRDKDNHEILNPKRLLLYTPHSPSYSQLTVGGKPEVNYFAIFGATAEYSKMFEKWQDVADQYFNFWSKKTFNGGLNNCNFTDYSATNTIGSSGQYSKSIFNNWRFSNYNQNLSFNVTPNASMYGTTFTYNKDNYSPADFLNDNNFVYSTISQIPLDFADQIKIGVSSFPLFGGVLEKAFQAILGFSPAWYYSNQWGERGLKLNFIAPCTTMQLGEANKTKLEYFPLQLFVNNADFTASGSRQQICSFNFRLTDRFKTENPNQIIEGNPRGKGGEGVWNTIYIDQDKDENGNWLFADHHKLGWDDTCVAIAPENPTKTFEVDFIDYKEIGISDCRMSFFNAFIASNDQLISVYENRHQTNSKFVDSLTLVDNSYKLNFYDGENTVDARPWPESAILPEPGDSDIRIGELIDATAQQTFNKVSKKGTSYKLLQVGVPYEHAFNSQGHLTNQDDIYGGRGGMLISPSELMTYDADKTKTVYLSDYGFNNLQDLLNRYEYLRLTFNVNGREIVYDYNLQGLVTSQIAEIGFKQNPAWLINSVYYKNQVIPQSVQTSATFNISIALNDIHFIPSWQGEGVIRQEQGGYINNFNDYMHVEYNDIDNTLTFAFTLDLYVNIFNHADNIKQGFTDLIIIDENTARFGAYISEQQSFNNLLAMCAYNAEQTTTIDLTGFNFKITDAFFIKKENNNI